MKMQRTVNLFAFPLLAAVAHAALAAPNISLEKIDDTPDLVMTDPDAGFPGGGLAYSAPVAVSNSLVWLAEHGYDRLLPRAENRRQAQIALVKTLAGDRYMNTDPQTGNGTSTLLRGLAAYVGAAGYRDGSLVYQGWREHPKEFSAGVTNPDLEWIKSNFRGHAGVWLNVGWYRQEQDDYRRFGGYWVTLVGYGVDEEGQVDEDVLIIHDPSPRGDDEKSQVFVKMVKLDAGKLAGVKDGLPRPARGHYLMTGNWRKKEGAVGILDGVVALRLPARGATAAPAEVKPPADAAERQKEAARRLLTAKRLVSRRPDLAREMLEEIVNQFSDTAAAGEAQDLLRKSR